MARILGLALVAWRCRPPFVGPPRESAILIVCTRSRRWDAPLLSYPEATCNAMTPLTAERLDQLARAANAAPSADNRHVFRLSVDGDKLYVWANDAFHRPPAHRRLLALLSVGAVLENLELRAARLGVALHTTLAPEIERRGPIACMEACLAEPELHNPLEASMDRRQSNRRLIYRGARLAPPQQAELAQQAAVQDAALEWLDTALRRRKALALLRSAESERFRNRVLHRELFDSIRFDLLWDAEADVGLPLGALGLPAPERLGFKLLRQWPVQKLGNALGLHRFIGFRAADLPCRLAPHVVAVTTAGAGDHDAISAGRVLQRAWLGATARGLACQVFAAPGLYTQEVASDVRPAVRVKLLEGWNLLCPGRAVWAVMRMGEAAPVPVRAKRAPTSALWTEKGA
jgi:hypothetical protein